MEELATKVAKKAKDLVVAYGDTSQIAEIENQDGETVKVKKPKAESVPDAKGMDEQKTKVTEFEG